MSGARPTRPYRDLAIALFLLALTTTVAALGSRGQGFTRDEGYYFDAGELYASWYEQLASEPGRALTRAAVDRAFSYNHEHPALMKTLFGLSWRLLHRCNCPRQGGRHPLPYPKPHRTFDLLSEAAAMRLPAHVFFGVLVALVYLLGAAWCGAPGGLLAAGLTACSPRLFFHAQLAAFDAPVATTWVACVYAYFLSLRAPRRAWLAGLGFGLALATKHNGFFLPVVLGLHFAIYAARTRRRNGRWPFPHALLWIAVLGPLIEIAHWPWLWFDTFARLREYFGFHLHHVYYNIEFLGVNYNKPPFPKSYAFLLTLFTVPVTTLALGLVGSVLLVLAAVRRNEDSSASDPHVGLGGLLVGLNALFPLAIIAFTGAPIFGGVKHWLAALPFIALLAGFGFTQLTRAIAPMFRSTMLRRGVPLMLGLWLVAPAALETARSHPYGLSHYNLLAGGPQGAATLGLNRQYWGYSTRGILAWLNRTAAPRAPVYWHDTNPPILNMNVREHLLRPDIGNTGLEEPGVRAADIAMVIHERHFDKYEYWIWDLLHTTRPATVLTHEGVPIVTVYQREPPRP